ncbi:DUF2157 domain-containing protein [Okeania sp.]|uniref:DUF2157 domain-containing protein n=1 Tax=Okeania sp. TaxID=3100323 RepID=UPI002B4B3B86|nr:DUF2157 domain-containing protein [Okeania sp.]MEB3339955.1 DUF2157 domain-containing protein [Okeania sp.]
MITEKFRRQLRKETKLWQTEGLIDDILYQQLSERYQFDCLEKAASSRFITILISLGSMLLGLGIITFVSANWQEWSREVKTLLLLTLFIGVNTVGFYLWRQQNTLLNTTNKKPKLGHGLLIFGALILGANIALMAQMFHIGGSPYGLYIVWGLGVLVMAYSLQITSLGIMAILLIGLGYFMGLSTVFSPGEFSWLQFIIEYMSLVGVLLFIPLAYLRNSRIIFFLSILIILIALEISLFLVFNLSNHGLWGAIALVLPPALLWGYDDIILPKIDSRIFQPLARNLAIWYLSIGFFLISFRGFWQNFSLEYYFGESLEVQWLTLAEVLIFVGLTVTEWLFLARPNQRDSQSWRLDLVSGIVLGLIVVTAILCFWHLSINEIPEIATFIINIEMFLLAAGLIRIGLARGNRGTFWGGLVLLTLQIVSRTFEYNTGLLLKSFVLILCGVGVIVAGLWYERHLSIDNK